MKFFIFVDIKKEEKLRAVDRKELWIINTVSAVVLNECNLTDII